MAKVKLNFDKEVNIKVMMVKGDDGKTAYDLAVENELFSGTLEEWIETFSTPENYITRTEFQKVTQAQYDELKANNQLVPNAFYLIVDDDSYSTLVERLEVLENTKEKQVSGITSKIVNNGNSIYIQSANSSTKTKIEFTPTTITVTKGTDSFNLIGLKDTVDNDLVKKSGDTIKTLTVVDTTDISGTGEFVVDVGHAERPTAYGYFKVDNTDIVLERRKGAWSSQSNYDIKLTLDSSGITISKLKPVPGSSSYYTEEYELFELGAKMMIKTLITTMAEVPEDMFHKILKVKYQPDVYAYEVFGLRYVSGEGLKGWRKLNGGAEYQVSGSDEVTIYYLDL